MELLKDYDCTILYHPGKANIVADALSRKSMGSLAHITLARRPIFGEVHQLEASGIQFDLGESGIFLAHIRAQSSLIEQIKAAQRDDQKLRKLIEDVRNGRNSDFSLDQDVLHCGQRLCVPDNHDLKKAILEEAHNSKYIVKAEHQRPAGLLQQIEIPEWKWKWIMMDFVTDRMTKSAHFLPVKTTFSAVRYAQLYVDEIVKLHEIPVPLFQIADLSSLNKRTLLATQSRQKAYVDNRRRNLEFSVGDQVFLRVSPMKGVMKFGKRGKLNPHYIGPFEILDRIGAVAYRLALPPELSMIHLVFHVSMLRKYLPDPSHVLAPQAIEIKEDLSFEEEPVARVDRQVKKLRSKEIASVKVVWKNHSVEEATWEVEDAMRDKYLYLFESEEVLKHVQNYEIGGLLNNEGMADKATIRRRFEKVDSNGDRDDRVSRYEIENMIENIHFSHVVDAKEAVTKLIQDLDVNKDDEISKKEFADGFTK
ncbi:uncharacterized protein [Arachis hypogaea]|uniref:uncharacterized protein n=1 Tax=Arachis hypogaea TaxID=3818 RepID=UPI003B216DFC